MFYGRHGRLARWRKWKSCDVGEAKEGLQNDLWRRWSNGRGWRMSCDVGKATEGLENELSRKWSDEKVGEWACDVGESKEGLKNELWHRWSDRRVGEYAVAWLKRRKGWRMSSDVGEVTETLENEQSSFYNPSATSRMSQLITQPFFRFTYVTSSSLMSPGEPPMGPPLMSIRYCLFGIFAATIHIWRPSALSASLGRAMTLWQGHT